MRWINTAGVRPRQGQNPESFPFSMSLLRRQMHTTKVQRQGVCVGNLRNQSRSDSANRLTYSDSVLMGFLATIEARGSDGSGAELCNCIFTVRGLFEIERLFAQY